INMSSWKEFITNIEHKIDIERWNNAWDNASACCSIQLTSTGCDDSQTTQSMPDINMKPFNIIEK
ncbi:unnamed protein product, partial [Adineta steineri]